MGDLLGLSVVHMNRTLQQLRRAGLIVSSRGRIQFPDLAALRLVAGARGPYADAADVPAARSDTGRSESMH